MRWKLKVDNLYTHIKSNNRMYALINAERIFPDAKETRIIRLVNR